MKRAILVFLAAILTACGGGGTSGQEVVSNQQQVATPPAVPTASGTPVSMAAMKAVFYGMEAGKSFSFSLTGSDNKGRKWSGSYAVSAKGATTITNGTQTANAYLSQAMTTIQQEGQAATTTLSSRYFRQSDQCLIYFASDTYNFVAASIGSPLPDTAKVGDFGQLADLINAVPLASGAIRTVWSLAPGVNGGSYLVLTTDSYHNGTGTDTETDTFTLDASGNPTGLTVRYVDRYLGSVLQDITLQGAKQ